MKLCDQDDESGAPSPMAEWNAMADNCQLRENLSTSRLNLRRARRGQMRRRNSGSFQRANRLGKDHGRYAFSFASFPTPYRLEIHAPFEVSKERHLPLPRC